jgi:hypothetical protein
MSKETLSALEQFGRSYEAFIYASSALVNAQSWDLETIIQVISGLHKLSAGLMQLALAMGDLDDKLNAIKRKLGIP